MATYAIETPNFQPAMRIVIAITSDFPASVTTSFDHEYISGEIIRLYIPKDYGMLQADRLVGEITVTGTDTFTIKIDTRSFDTFINASATSLQQAQAVPIGEDNDILTAATRNVLPSGDR